MRCLAVLLGDEGLSGADVRLICGFGDMTFMANGLGVRERGGYEGDMMGLLKSASSREGWGW